MKESYIVGIDIGGTYFRIGAVGTSGKTIYFRKIRVTEVFCTGNVLEDLVVCLKLYCTALEEKGKKADAISIGFPATLNRERTVVLQAPNIAFMENLPVVETLTAELQIPVFIERDVTMALYYDRKKYGLQNCEFLAGCYFGTGIGNALMFHGKMILGKNGTAGELGHIPVDGSEELCGCGNAGCIENLAGGKYLARLCEEKYVQTPVERIFLDHGKEPLLHRFVDRMAMVVATEINILNPDCVLIGGGVPGMKGFPVKELEERIHYRTRKPYPEQDLRLIFTDDEEEKCVIGAALMAKEKLSSE